MLRFGHVIKGQQDNYPVEVLLDSGADGRAPGRGGDGMGDDSGGMGLTQD